jgi:uncharacterized protein (TIGR00369 family)
MATERTRTVTWEDPLASARAGKDLAGTEYLERIMDGSVPPAPFGRLLGFALEEIGEGYAVFEVDPAEFHYNPIGSVHGGLAATLLDSAMGCAIHTLLPRGRGYTTLELKVNFVRGMTRETGRVRAVGRVIHLGGRIATAEGKILGDAGALHAHATTTCLLLGEAPAGEAP